MTKVYHFFNCGGWETNRFIWKNETDLELMSSIRYIDKLFECVEVKDGIMMETHRGLLPRDDETLYIDMQRLRRTNESLYWRTLEIFQNFDAIYMTPSAIDDYLATLESFVRGKIINENN